MPNPPSSGLPNAQSYTVTADTVLDNGTGLVWQRHVETAPANAKSYCEELSLGGSTGWRVPRAIDLMSLTDFMRQMPALDPVAFTSTTPLTTSVSSTPVAGAPGMSIIVSLSTGGVGAQVGGPVMCVSGGRPQPSSSHYTAANGTVRDNWTGLTWQQHLEMTYSFDQAAAYCRRLSLDGAGWRVPSLNELESLVDRGPTALPDAIDHGSFPDPLAVDQVWTSSTTVWATGNAWMIKFNRGGMTFAQPTGATNAVRCVR
jgi:Protein of unknown function (DUF1566)